MANTENTAKIYGLVGSNIGHSFSQKYFTEKFRKLNLDCEYRNFDLKTASEFSMLKTNLRIHGFNVTIPYKTEILPYLDNLTENAKQIGAVNTIKVGPDGLLTGHNTDWIGFTHAISTILLPHHKSALILGTGGASKAVAYALDQLDIEYHFVSSSEQKDAIPYRLLDIATIAQNQIVINCTPLGTYPNIAAHPDVPFEGFSPQHIAFDLIYNPEITAFLQKAAAHGAVTKNGYDMLVNQAEKSWEIWNM